MVESGAEVRTLGRRTSAQLDALGVEQELGSILDAETCRVCLKGMDEVYHLAGMVSRDLKIAVYSMTFMFVVRATFCRLP